MRTKYVCGFIFDSGLTRVKLILKDRPAWQAGNFNGIGGHIELNEIPREAMKREFLEEAGVKIDHWDYFCVIYGTTAEIYFFRASVDDTIFDSVRSMESEQIYTFDTKKLPPNVIENITWLVPMAAMNRGIEAEVVLMVGDDKRDPGYEIKYGPGIGAHNHPNRKPEEDGITCISHLV